MTKGKRTATISVKSFGTLAKKAENIRFFSLENQYRSRTISDDPPRPKKNSSRVVFSSTFKTVTDQPTYITTVTKGALTKKVENSYGGPKELYELEQLIDEITDSARWTGHPDVNKDIPYYDSFPVYRSVKFRGFVQTARWKSHDRGSVDGWKSKYILSLVKNPESFDLKVGPAINLADFNGYVVDVTGKLVTGVREDYTLNVTRISRVRRYFDP